MTKISHYVAFAFIVAVIGGIFRGHFPFKVDASGGVDLIGVLPVLLCTLIAVPLGWVQIRRAKRSERLQRRQSQADGQEPRALPPQAH